MRSPRPPSTTAASIDRGLAKSRPKADARIALPLQARLAYDAMGPIEDGHEIGWRGLLGIREGCMARGRVNGPEPRVLRRGMAR